MADDVLAGRICPVILSGGSGTRLWPMSRESYPKQLLALATERSLLQDAVHRVSDGRVFTQPTLVCNEEHRFIVAEQMRALGIAPARIVLEPAGRNTAPAVAVAALLMAEDGKPDEPMLVLPSDHVVADAAAFLEAVRAARAAALRGMLVTFGIRAAWPATGYGYIRRGRALDGCDGCFRVDGFAEKPDTATAAAYLADGRWLWNSGMFLFTARSYLDELGRLEPKLLAGCRKAVEGARPDLDFTRLEAAPFAALSPRSIDYAVMERTERAAVVPADIGWSDVGSWTSLWEIAPRDQNGNAALGDVMLRDSRRSYVRSEGPLVAALGIEGLIIVATPDVVLVVPQERAQDVRTLVDCVRAAGRRESTQHLRVYRPWGYYQSIHEGEGFQVKRITVNPGASLSLQKHMHRAEHWVVVHGAAEVTRGEDRFVLHENESAYIPPGTVHRLANPGESPVNLIEVQTGLYLGEDDIVRLDDRYGRS